MIRHSDLDSLVLLLQASGNFHKSLLFVEDRIAGPHFLLERVSHFVILFPGAS